MDTIMIYDDMVSQFEQLCAAGQPEDAAAYILDKVGTETIAILLARAVSRQLMVQDTEQTAKLADAQAAVQTELAAPAVMAQP